MDPIWHAFVNTHNSIIAISANTEQIDKAKEIIKKLTFKYQPDSFENPGMSKCSNDSIIVTRIPFS